MRFGARGIFAPGPQSLPVAVRVHGHFSDCFSVYAGVEMRLCLGHRKLLDQLAKVIRFRHYSYRGEQTSSLRVWPFSLSMPGAVLPGTPDTQDHDSPRAVLIRS